EFACHSITYVYIIALFENFSRDNLLFSPECLNTLPRKLINTLFVSSQCSLVFTCLIGVKIVISEQFIGSVLLVDPVFGVVMRVLVVLGISYFFAASVMPVPQMAWNRQGAVLVQVSNGLVNRDHGRIGFW